MKIKIVIPTYNRREKLKRILDILCEQTDKNFIVTILDNNSEYDSFKLIEEFINILEIKIIKKQINTGMADNIATAFTVYNDGWMWLLGDDDLILKTSIETIRKKIMNEKNNIFMYKYALNSKEEKEINTLEELIDFYDQKKDSKGSLIFMGNNIYNLNVIKEYIPYIFKYSYTQIPHIIFILFVLKDKKSSISILNEEIIKYEIPSKKERHKIGVFLGLSTIFHVNLLLNKEYQKKFIKIFTTAHYLRIFEIVGSDPSFFNLRFLKYIYINQYKYFLNFFNKILYKLLLIFFKFSIFRKLILKIFNFLEEKYIERIRKNN